MLLATDFSEGQSESASSSSKTHDEGALDRSSRSRTQEEEVEAFPDMGVQHLTQGSANPQYISDPPTSGPHGQAPAP